MSARACIANLLRDGTIDRERAVRFTSMLDDLEADLAKTLGPAGAQAEAGAILVTQLENSALIDRRQKLRQIAAQHLIMKGLQAHMAKGGKAGQYAIALFDHHEAVKGVSNISNRHTAVRNMAWSRMNGFLGQFERDLLGRVKNEAQLSNVVRELFGEKTGDAGASEIAAAFADTAEYLRTLFNEAGGHIGRLDGWGLPQAHDSLSVAKAGFDSWAAYIKPRLNRLKMLDETTGLPFTDGGLDTALRDVWKTIASDGLDKMEPGQMIGSKVANRRADHRFLIFKNADTWMEYQKAFGVGDPFNAIVGHIDGMARDIAAMQILGPNPGLTVRWLGDILRNDAAPTIEGGKVLRIEKQAAKAARETDRMWRMYTGELTMPDPTNRGVARFFSGVRSANVASQMGSAFVSAAATDPMFLTVTAKFNGLPATQVLSNYLAAFNPADASARNAARDAGLVFSEITTRAERMWRDGGSFNLHEATKRMADGVLRASFLSPHTVAAKEGYGLSVMQQLAARANKAFDALARPVQLGFERYGIDAAAWDVIRATPITDQEGRKLLRPGDLASRTDIKPADAEALGLKLFEMIDSETRFAVPGESLRAQTMLAVGGKGSLFQRGTVAGELVHSMTQYKGYSVIAIMTHWQRMLYGEGGMSRTAYAMTLPILLTLGGLAAVQLKLIENGKDPLALDDPRTWAKAYVQGGGQGILGDFVSAGLGGQSRTGGTLLSFAAGPTISNVVDPLINLTLGNVGQAADGKNTNLGAEMLRLTERNLPGSSLWYSRLATRRLFLDRLDKAVDPHYSLSIARMERRAAQDGTAYWWAPGETAPERAPEFENAFGENGQ